MDSAIYHNTISLRKDFRAISTNPTAATQTPLVHYSPTAKENGLLAMRESMQAERLNGIGLMDQYSLVSLRPCRPVPCWRARQRHAWPSHRPVRVWQDNARQARIIVDAVPSKRGTANIYLDNAVHGRGGIALSIELEILRNLASEQTSRMTAWSISRSRADCVELTAQLQPHRRAGRTLHHK